MLRKTLCYVILLSMTLHCASRLGALSFLYEKRHAIAYAVGLVIETPIAMCSSDYDVRDGLVIEDGEADDSIPPILSQAHEIQLFISDAAPLLKNKSIALPLLKFSIFQISVYQSPSRAVFHPPAFAWFLNSFFSPRRSARMDCGAFIYHSFLIKRIPWRNY